MKSDTIQSTWACQSITIRPSVNPKPDSWCIWLIPECALILTFGRTAASRNLRHCCTALAVLCPKCSHTSDQTCPNRRPTSRTSHDLLTKAGVLLQASRTLDVNGRNCTSSDLCKKSTHYYSMLSTEYQVWWWFSDHVLRTGETAKATGCWCHCPFATGFDRLLMLADKLVWFMIIC